MKLNHSNSENNRENVDNSVLYISDLDGTLLNSDKALSTFTIQIINECIKNGMLFSVATARAFESVKPILEPLDLKLPIILHNGVVIYSPTTSQYISKYFLPTHIVHEIIEIFQSNHLNPIIYTLGTPGNSKVYYTRAVNYGETNYVGDRKSRKDPRFIQIEKLPLDLENIMEINVIGKYEELIPLKTRIEQKFDVSIHFMEDIYAPGYYWLELCHFQGTKRNALQFLKKYLNVGKIVCFGDNHNDLSMFELADECYAVSNAINELKNIANDILLSNDENGVANFLKTR